MVQRIIVSVTCLLAILKNVLAVFLFFSSQTRVFCNERAVHSLHVEIFVLKMKTLRFESCFSVFVAMIITSTVLRYGQ